MPEFTKPELSISLSRELRIKTLVDEMSDGKLEAVIRQTRHPEFAFMQPTVYIKNKTNWIGWLSGQGKILATFSLYGPSAYIPKECSYGEVYEMVIGILDKLGLIKVIIF